MAALLAVLGGGAGAQARTGEVRVFLGDLAWVYARAGLPALSGGRVTVPVTEGCALLGATCTAGAADGVTVGTGSAAVRLPLRGGQVELRSLAASVGARVKWDAAARAADVTGGPEASGEPDLRGIPGVADAGPGAGPAPLAVNVVTGRGPYDTLTLSSAAGGLRGLTLLSRLR
ncbi:hypothetical protein, partial [Deinococcus pimensis]|uniref:hypothetical protein n=1 Tax=Deinococcus pimensis TaxID=309888 RepID=UPI00146FAB2F